jgi:hypothetical protein
MFGSGTPGLDMAFLRVAAWCALAALLLAGIVAYLERTRTGRRSVFCWRVSVAVGLFVAAEELNVLTDQQADWSRIHRAVGLATLLLSAASVTLILTTVSRYHRRGTPLRDDGQSI